MSPHIVNVPVRFTVKLFIARCLHPECLLVLAWFFNQNDYKPNLQKSLEKVSKMQSKIKSVICQLTPSDQLWVGL